MAEEEGEGGEEEGRQGAEKGAEFVVYIGENELREKGGDDQESKA